MKLKTDNLRRQRQRGSATIIFTILLSIMMILILAEGRALSQLHQEQRQLELRQVHRLTRLPTVHPLALMDQK